METTDLYAGIDIRTGKVITSLAQTHSTPDFLRLMNQGGAQSRFAWSEALFFEPRGRSDAMG